MEADLYPLKFKPIFKDKLWGGTMIRDVLGKDFSPLPNCGELWALSGVPGEESEVENGFLQGNGINELVEVYMGDLVGDKVFDRYGERFPVLVKLIDTRAYLSVQVHPDDAMALRHTGSEDGKTEMWVVLKAGPEAELISGFKRETTKQECARLLESGQLSDILNVVNVKEDDVVFVPAGRVHAIGPQILLAEIQQTSDITYRLWDWDRIGLDGLPRELHTDLALEALDYSRLENPVSPLRRKPNEPQLLVDCPQFQTRFLELSGNMEIDHAPNDSFMILLCTRGQFTLKADETKVLAEAGEAILVPAAVPAFSIQASGADILTVHIP